MKTRGLHTHIAEGLETCHGCMRLVGIGTLTIADDETGRIVQCPRCPEAPRWR